MGKIIVPQVDASSDDNDISKVTDKNKSKDVNKSNKSEDITEGKNREKAATNPSDKNAALNTNKENQKTGITSILGEVNALVALIFGYKNLKKKDWKIANLHD